MDDLTGKRVVHPLKLQSGLQVGRHDKRRDKQRGIQLFNENQQSRVEGASIDSDSTLPSPGSYIFYSGVLTNCFKARSTYDRGGKPWERARKEHHSSFL